MLKYSYLSNEYMVSDKGYILSKKGKPLKPSKNHSGYLIVNLLVHNKRIGVAVHTLVARAFCDNYKKGLTVNHKDGNKENNNANNLEWVTPYENTQHAIKVLNKNKFGSNNPNAQKIKMIDKTTGEIKKQFDSIIDAAKYIEPNSEYKRLRNIQSNIWRALKGLRKTYKNHIWRYL